MKSLSDKKNKFAVLLAMLLAPGCVTLRNWAPPNWTGTGFFEPEEGTRENRIAFAAPDLGHGTGHSTGHSTGHKGRTMGVVVAAHPLASDAGIEMLNDGGNAVDAAIAASFVISVVRPQSTGIGGGGFMILHNANKNRTEAFDFRERAPARATAELFRDLPPKATIDGPMAIATPGLVQGLADIHAISGKLPWKSILQPAIRIARDGFPVYPQLAIALQERADVLRQFPSSTAIFFRGGQPYKLGETLIQSDLAATLTRIAANGSREFTSGETADRIVSAVQKSGGILQASDLRDYRMIRRSPVTGEFAGHRIISMPPPSSGGTHLIEILNILRNDRERIARAGFGSTLHWHLMAEAMRRAFADRATFMGDPAFVTVPLARLTALDHADAWRVTIDSAKATPSKNLDVKKVSLLPESESTTHISVLDGQGNAVATTQTINFTFGSCMVASGTGIVLNDEMDDFSRGASQPNAFGLIGNEANAIAPFKTPLSSMTPTIVFGPDGNVKMILGSPGGPRIISATLQTIFNQLALNMPPADAVHAPRIHHQWIPDKLFVETEWASSQTVRRLKEMGHDVDSSKRIGDIQAIFVDSEGVTGVSDTRSEGRPRIVTPL